MIISSESKRFKSSGSVYSNMEMVLKQLFLCQKELAKYEYGGQNGRKFRFPNY